MLPASFKIPGHSGTDFKNRKAFRRMKEGNKLHLFKYGKQFGQGQFEVDEKRIEQVAKEKRRKGVLMIIGILLFFLIAALSVYTFLTTPYFNPSHSTIEVPDYNWEAHYSENLKRELDNMKFMLPGYLAWSQADYEKAIFWFEKSESNPEYLWRRKYALLGLYKELCNTQNKNCLEYESNKKLIETKLGEQIRSDHKVQFLKDIDVYNQEMFVYFGFERYLFVDNQGK